MQGTLVQSLVREDLTSDGVTKSMCHNYWAHTVGPASCSYWDHMCRSQHSLQPMPHSKRSHYTPCSPCPTAREATTMRSPHTSRKSNPCSEQLEKACTQQRRPTTCKLNEGFFFKYTKQDGLWTVKMDKKKREIRQKWRQHGLIISPNPLINKIK